jgi:hypothetical protein
VHGLLEWSKLDDVSERERRMVGLMKALEVEEDGVVARVSWRVKHWRLVTGMAAMLAITALILLGVPTRTSAEAIVRASLSASNGAGDRRYTVRVKPPRATEIQQEPIGTLDVRDADHVVIQARTPFGDQVTVGRNEKGAWAIRPDGTVDTYPPRHAWPNWVNFGQSTVLLVSIDELMTWLQRSYTLTRGEREAVPGGDGTLCDRVTAAHKPGESPEPPRVELWIDPQSRVVRRMELHWIPLGGVERDGPADRPPDGDNRPPPPPDDPRGFGPDGPPDMPPPPEGGDRPPPDEGPEGRPHGEPPPEFRGQPPHRPPPGGPRRRGPRPEFLGGPPDFHHHPPPPTLIVFELVPGASFDAGWFDPASHATPPNHE